MAALGEPFVKDAFFEEEEFGQLVAEMGVTVDAFGVKKHPARIFLFPLREVMDDGTVRTTSFVPGMFTNPATEEGTRIVEALRDRMHVPKSGERLNWDVRNNHVCASEMGAWVGVCPYAAKEMEELKLASSRDVVLHWKQNKRDTSAFQADLDRGHREEPVFIDIMRQVFGLETVKFPMGTLCSEKMAATPDAIGANGLFGMEIKSAKGDIRNAMPASHYLQVQTGMACTAPTADSDPMVKHWLYVSGTTGGNRPGAVPIMLSVFLIPFNDGVRRRLRAATGTFTPPVS